MWRANRHRQAEEGGGYAITAYRTFKKFVILVYSSVQRWYFYLTSNYDLSVYKQYMIAIVVVLSRCGTKRTFPIVNCATILYDFRRTTTYFKDTITFMHNSNTSKTSNYYLN